MAKDIIFTLKQVLQGKGTKIKNKDYLKSSQYIEPFLEKMSNYTNDFTVKVKVPDQITLTDNGEVITDDITFNRVNIEAVLPDDYAYDGHTQVVGMVYGLDVAKPVCKFYSGAERSACTNLCVFSPTGLVLQDINPMEALDYSSIDDLMNRVETIGKTLKILDHTVFQNNETNINENLGRWIRNSMNMDYRNAYGKVKIATSAIIDAYKELFVDEESDYYVGVNDTNMLNVYNAFTQQITDGWNKDCFNRYEKTILIAKILGIK